MTNKKPNGRTNNKVLSIRKGTVFGMWKTLRPVKDRWDYITCKCECGNTKDVNVYSLTSGKSKSCGCATIALRGKTQGLHNDHIGPKVETKLVRSINRKRLGKD